MSDVASLIADLIAANVPGELIGRVAAALAGPRGKVVGNAKVAYTADFEAFWKAYPTDQNMSKLEAFHVWQKMPEEERELAQKALGPFKEWLKKQPADYRCVHACRFLSKKRFEGHAKAPELKLVAVNPGKFVSRDSAEWGPYAEAYKAQHGKYPPVNNQGGWFFQEDRDAG